MKFHLSAVADIHFEDGPPMINSENALLRGAVMFNVRDRDLGSTVKDAVDKINASNGILPEGYFLEWSGQYENLIRGQQTLMWIVPIVFLIIFFALVFCISLFKGSFFKFDHCTFCPDWRRLYHLFLGCQSYPLALLSALLPCLGSLLKPVL